MMQVDGFYGQLGEKAAETILARSHHLEARERTVKSKTSGVSTRVVALPVYNEKSGGAAIHTIAADSKVVLEPLSALLMYLCMCITKRHTHTLSSPYLFEKQVSRKSLFAILHRMSQLVRDAETWVSTSGPPSDLIEPMSLQRQLGVKLYSLISLQRVEMLKERVEQVKQIMIQNVELVRPAYEAFRSFTAVLIVVDSI